MGLSKALRVAARGVSTSSAARMSLPALTTAQAKPSLMSAIFGGSAGPAMPPMDQPVPGLAVPDPPVAPATAPGTIVTTLSNGAKIASEDTGGASLAVGMYIAAGSKPAREQAFTVALLWAAVAGFPISWKKCDGGPTVKWIGADLCLNHSTLTVSIPDTMIADIKDRGRLVQKDMLMTRSAVLEQPFSED